MSSVGKFMRLIWKQGSNIAMQEVGVPDGNMLNGKLCPLNCGRWSWQGFSKAKG